MQKAKKKQIQAAFEEIIGKLKAIGITDTDMQCYKCKHSVIPFKKCQRCYGFSASVLTCYEDKDI
jgi:hypothetical protein